MYPGKGNPNRGAVGADAILHDRRLLALDPGEEPAEVEDEHHDEGHAAEDDPEVQNHRLASPAAAARTATTALMRGQARGGPAARARRWAARRRASRRRRRWTGTRARRTRTRSWPARGTTARPGRRPAPRRGGRAGGRGGPRPRAPRRAAPRRRGSAGRARGSW